MPPGYYFLVLSCLFATSLARKSQNAWDNNDWEQSNTMSKEPGERHDAMNFDDTIDIDGDNQGWSINSQMADWPGSGAGHVNDDWGSGWSDDEDDGGEYDSFSGYPEYKQPSLRPKPGGGLPDDKVVHPNTEQPDGSKGDPNKDIGYEPPKEDGSNIDIELPDDKEEPVDEEKEKDPPPGTNDDLKHSPIIGTPGLLPGIIGGAVVGLLCAVLLVMFIVYRMRKKDEGSYALEEPKMTSPSRGYTRAPTKEYWA